MKNVLIGMIFSALGSVIYQLFLSTKESFEVSGLMFSVLLVTIIIVFLELLRGNKST